MNQYVRSFILVISISFAGISFAQNPDNSGFPDYKNVEGFGFNTIGGSGGELIYVTNLLKSGDGSLAAAIETDKPRIVVFDVAGIIDLEGSVLNIKNPNITVAGQTAPDPGITIIKGGILVTTHEVIIQHIKVRPGEAGNKKKSGWEVDGIATSQGAYNVIIDHCSATWATDENISSSGPRFEGANVEEWRKNTSHKILISNCIIAEGLSNSTHGKGEHSKGSLIHDNTTEIAIVGNLYVSNVRRNPFFKGGSQGVVANNYILNPGREIIHYTLSPREWHGHEFVTGKMTVVGNVIEFGRDTPEGATVGNFRGPVEVYWDDNKVISASNGDKLDGMHTLVDEKPVWPSGFKSISSEDVKEKVLLNVGARPWNRDEVDKRIISQVMQGTSRIIDSENEVGGYPKIEPVYKRFNANEWNIERMVRK